MSDEIITNKDTKMHSICFALILPIGSIDDPMGKSGMTHLIEHMIFRKAGNLTQKEIYAKYEEMGVYLRAITGKNYLRFDFICRTDVFAEVVKLFSESFYEINYSKQDLEKEKNTILAEIRQREYTYSEKLVDFLWADERNCHTILGNKENLLSISLEEVIVFKNKILDTEGEIFLFGNYSEENLLLVGQLFKNTLRTKNTEKIFSNTINNNIAKINFLHDKSEDCSIYYTYHINTEKEDRVKNIVLMQMIENILLDGHAAYLKEVLREEKGYIYEFDSRLEIVNNEIIFVFNFEISADKVLDAIEELENQLLQFMVNEKLLRYIRAFFCDNYYMNSDNSHDLFYDYVKNYLHFNKIISPKEYSEIIANLTESDYNEFFRKMSKEKKIFICGKINSKQKKIISNYIK